jgi:glycosyltransferase involved in cell wall biosynthesis
VSGIPGGNVAGAASPPDPRPLVSIVAPAFNEADILETNVERICSYMDTLADRWRWELILVDDGSTDATAELAAAAARTRAAIAVERHPVNLGLGQALRTGFRRAAGAYVVVVDLDLTYAPEHIGQMLDRLHERRADVVLASPYMAGGRTSRVPWTRRFLSRWGNRFLAMTARGAVAGGNISTLTGMVRAYDARFLRLLNLKSTGMEINTEIIYKGTVLNARIEEVPAHLDWSGRKQAQSTVSAGRIRRGIALSLLAGFILRPFLFFIVPAGFLAALSLYVLAWIAIHVFTYYGELAPGGGSFDLVFSRSIALAFEQSPHAFLVAGVSIVLTFQLFSLGILALQAKQYFEELFHFTTHVYSHSRELERKLGEWRADVERRGA